MHRACKRKAEMAPSEPLSAANPVKSKRQHAAVKAVRQARSPRAPLRPPRDSQELPERRWHSQQDRIAAAATSSQLKVPSWPQKLWNPAWVFTWKWMRARIIETSSPAKDRMSKAHQIPSRPEAEGWVG